MPAAKKNIKNIQSLEREIQRLRREAKGMEKKFDDSFVYLQENYSTLIMNSVLPEKGVFKSIPQSIMQLILQHERLRNALTELAENLVNKASDGIEFLLDKFFAKN
jgi:hypothetical protein